MQILETGLFQFLIGRLKTDAKRMIIKTDAQFQFLIGRLKTHAFLHHPPGLIVFQFLIGRLKTCQESTADGTGH